MPYTSDLVDELNTLIRFDLESGQHGIKVHKTADLAGHQCRAATVRQGADYSARRRYLTSLGREAAGHAQAMLGLLTTGVAASGWRRTSRWSLPGARRCGERFSPTAIASA